MNRTGARKIAVFTGIDAAYWAAGTGERILFDFWKNQVAYILRNSYSCNVSIVANSSIDTENISRISKLPDGADCSSSASTGGGGSIAAHTELSDANLWIWMYGNGGLGAPPVAYTEFQPLGDLATSASYLITTANSLSGN